MKNSEITILCNGSLGASTDEAGFVWIDLILNPRLSSLPQDGELHVMLEFKYKCLPGSVGMLHVTELDWMLSGHRILQPRRYK